MPGSTIAVPLLVSGSLLAALAGADRPARAAVWTGARPRRPAASIGPATVRPSNLPATGGSVTVEVTVSPASRVSVQSVSVSASAPGSRTAFSAAAGLMRTGSTRWRGIIRVQPNPQKRTLYSYLRVDAVTSGGPVSRQTGQVKLAASRGTGGGSGGDGPPPPPNI
jgi:hypothetical protein